jgi:hypothetical protein
MEELFANTKEGVAKRIALVHDCTIRGHIKKVKGEGERGGKEEER